MEKRNPDLFSLILRIPEATLRQLDEVAAKVRLSRSAFIRKSIARNLAFTRTHEQPLVDRPEIRDALST